MTALLLIRDLTVSYRRDGAEVAALKHVSLDVAAGERLAIIGESGSGKSTLALAIAGLLPASSRIDGCLDWFLPSSPSVGAKAPPSEGGVKERRPSEFITRSTHTPLGGRDIGFVFQDPSASLDPVMSVGEQIAEVAHTHLRLT
ncbi:MAG: ATP-binding cassette domain-containing protein, partial [Mesorhizobium sp.]